MITDKQAMREKFEAWAEANFMPLTPWGNGYMDWKTNSAWCGFVAALEAAEAARECAVPPYDSVMGEAAQRYIKSVGGSDDVLPQTFRWQGLWDAMIAAAPSSAKPADYPNPGAHTPLRPAVTEQEPAAPGVVSEAPKKLPGLKDLEYVIERLRETCSFRDEEGDVTDGLESLLNAIKAAQPSADDAPLAVREAWPECSGDPASCPENEGYGCCKPNPADRAMGGEA